MNDICGRTSGASSRRAVRIRGFQTLHIWLPSWRRLPTPLCWSIVSKRQIPRACVFLWRWAWQSARLRTRPA